MQITVCDVCEKKIEPKQLQVKLGKSHYRFQVLKYDEADKRGVIFKNSDICTKCFFKLIEAFIGPEDKVKTNSEAST